VKVLYCLLDVLDLVVGDRPDFKFNPVVNLGVKAELLQDGELQAVPPRSGVRDDADGLGRFANLFLSFVRCDLATHHVENDSDCEGGCRLAHVLVGIDTHVIEEFFWKARFVEELNDLGLDDFSGQFLE
jgi:hypothetical protein